MKLNLTNLINQKKKKKIIHIIKIKNFPLIYIQQKVMKIIIMIFLN